MVMLMTTKQMVALIIVGGVSLFLLIISVFLLRGKGSWMIAGYNTTKDKKRYDEVALCKFVGKIVLPISLLLPSIVIGDILSIDWLPIAFLVFTISSVIFALIYANTNNRFLKK